MSLTYDPTLPRIRQLDRWSCLAKSLGWSAAAYGLEFDQAEFDRRVLAYNITNRGGFLTDKTGHDVADFATEQFAPLGLTAEYTPVVSYDEVVADAGRYPIIIGGSLFLHYTAVRYYEPGMGLILANSTEGWQSIWQVMNRAQFHRYSPLARIRVATPWMIAEGGEHRGKVGLRGDYRAVAVGGSTILLPTTEAPVGGVVANPRQRGRVLHQLRQ
jgi:hypothetical protein